MYFEDNSEYTYFLPECVSLPEVKNIGWLDCEFPFVKGQVDFCVVNKLMGIVLRDNKSTSYIVNRIRGFYKCVFCEDEMIKITNGENVEYLGMSEIWIPSICEGEYYAFPSLMLHYIQSHEYRPPDKFIASVLNLDLNKKFIAQDIYKERIKKLNIDFWFG
ncbi:hypothetical protein [Superficieibacter sp. 1612_C1]|uniref:DUF7919 family protein n=1 Tax=Superficieibacter sp. 1612_C1 TaxID=2780382 RepID=UPI0018838327|nr:hypothetical protein [Superficieibacter sp. 1612_C1]